MDIGIQSTTYTQGYSYHIEFEDGLKGVVNLKPFLYGKAFIEIKDPDYFRRAFVDPQTKTITWPNGVDLAPEAIRKVLEKN